MITVCHPCRSDHTGPWTTLRYQKRTKPQEPPSRRDRTVSIPSTYKNWSLDREKLAENRILKNRVQPYSNRISVKGGIKLWFPQLKVNRDSNVDFWIDPDPNVHRVASKM